MAVTALGVIKNDYDDYLGTGQPLKTDDDLKALATRYLFRAGGNWFLGAQGSAANYQVLGATAEDDLVLETLGVRGFKSAALGAVVLHDRATASIEVSSARRSSRPPATDIDATPSATPPRTAAGTPV